MKSLAAARHDLGGEFLQRDRPIPGGQQHLIVYGIVVVALLTIGHFVLLAYSPGGGYARIYAPDAPRQGW